MEMESLAHGADNEGIKSNPRVSCSDYSEKSVLNSAQGKIDLALSVIYWIEQRCWSNVPVHLVKQQSVDCWLIK